MIKRLLLLVLGGIIIILIGLWVLTGGPRRAIQSTSKLNNPLSYFFGTGSIGTDFRLPWQGSVDLPGNLFEDATDTANPRNNSSENTSPYSGSVQLEQSAADKDLGNEYIQVISSDSELIDITGWTIENAAGKRVVIPPAADPYIQGVVNPVHDVMLSNSGRAYIYTGPSPLGVSFRENRCIGYLNGDQTFSPELSTDCPNPSEALPETTENLQRYGESCFAFINTVSACELVTTIPANLSPDCISFLARTYSYNGCVSVHQSDADFPDHTWRLYLALGTELWNNQHDVLRLYDVHGLLVSEVTY